MNAGSVRVTTPSDTEIAMARDFDAPRHLVFAAWTKPELLRRWYGARGWNLVVCKVDLRVGGAWRFVWRGPDGSDMGAGGCTERSSRSVASSTPSRSTTTGIRVDR